MAISKITLNGVTQMDVTQDTVTANTMLNGVTSLKNDGTDITGNIQRNKYNSNYYTDGFVKSDVYNVGCLNNIRLSIEEK